MSNSQVSVDSSPHERKNESHMNDNACTFINALNEEEFKNIPFSDSLICFSPDSVPLGTYQCHIEPLKNCSNSTVVRASTTGIFGDIRFHNSVESYVSPSFETTKHIQIETIKVNGQAKTKEITIERLLDVPMYIVKIRELVDEREVSTNIMEFSLEDFRGFISEGADLLLQRLLAKKKFNSPLEVIGLDTNNELCRISYIDLGERNITIGDSEITVMGIQRTIHPRSGIPLSWQTYLMDDGHLILRTQVGSPITIKVDKVPIKSQDEEYLPVPELPQVLLNWEKDMQLYSHYRDRKDEIKASYLLYLRDHPDVRDLLADYLKSILLLKPDDTIKFTRNYFKTFSARNEPTNTFPMFHA